MKNLTRRDFLKKAFAAAAGAAAAGALGPAVSLAGTEGLYTPGTYTATVKGARSDVTVAMTFSGSRIMDVQISASGEPGKQLAREFRLTARRMLEAQSADVELFQGAAASRNAVREAAARCIADARGAELIRFIPEAEAVNGPFSSWMDPPEEVTVFDAEYTADVCICGHGYAGISACRELAEQGKSVILIEKVREDAYRAPGDTLGALNAAALGKHGVPYIDPVVFYQSFLTNAGTPVNQELVMKYARNSAADTDWFLSGLSEADLSSVQPAFFPENEGQLRRIGPYSFWPSALVFQGGCSLTRVQEINRKAARDHGARIMFGISACQVLMKNGAVAGVIGKTESGYVRIHCKAAVLATGGFGENPEMLRYFYRSLRHASPSVQPSASVQNGQGIRMGLWAGGCLESEPIAVLAPDQPAESIPQALWLDSMGKRFCNEFHGDIERRSRPFQFADRGDYYAVFDSRIVDYRRSMVPLQGARSRLLDDPEAFRKALDAALTRSSANGTAVFAAGRTLEELADAIGLQGQARKNMIASVERYNRLCEDGRDDDFGREAEVLFPVNEGPFCAVRVSPASVSSPVTLGGLVTDGEQNVLDADRTPIPGLYASGNTCGGRFGSAYTPPIPGLSIGMAVVLGRECGRSVARFLEA